MKFMCRMWEDILVLFFEFKIFLFYEFRYKFRCLVILDMIIIIVMFENILLR